MSQRTRTEKDLAGPVPSCVPAVVARGSACRTRSSSCASNARWKSCSCRFSSASAGSSRSTPSAVWAEHPKAPASSHPPARSATKPRRHLRRAPTAGLPAGSMRPARTASSLPKIAAVEAPGARRILNEVARVAESFGIRAYDEDAQRGLLRHAIVRLGWRTDEGMLTVVTSNRDLPHAEEFAQALLEIDPRIMCVAQNVNPRPGNAILGSRDAGARRCTQHARRASWLHV